MKHFYLLFLCSLQSLFAQTYHPDKILIDGVTHDYSYHHMEPYFSYYPEKRPVVNNDSTIISRGYIAEYEIIEQQYYLRDLKTPIDNNYEHLVSNTQKIIPEKEANLKMYWIDGLFDVGIGKAIFANPKDTLNSTFNSYYVFEVKRGIIKKTSVFSYKQYKAFKDYQWERFKNSPEYQKVYRKLEETIDPSYILEHIYKHVLFYSKRNWLKKEI